MHLVCVGISHKTAPLELRERLALDDEQATAFGRRLLDEAAGRRGGRPLDLQSHRALPVRRRYAGGRAGRPAPAREHADVDLGELRAVGLQLLRRRRDRAPLPRRLEPRLDGRRRRPDPRPDQERLRARLRLGLHEHGLQQALPPRARGRQAGAHRHLHRRPPGLGQLGRGRAGAPGARQARASRRAGARRRRDERADGDATCVPRRHRSRAGREPHLRDRRGAGRPVRRSRGAVRAPRQSCSSRPTSSSRRPPRASTSCRASRSSGRCASVAADRCS